MKISVLYFGELRESVDTAEEATEVVSGSTVSDLIEHLKTRGEPWQSALTSPDPLRVAVNQDMANPTTVLTEGAEVALFRPVTGG